jgi:hypothetical protein
VNLVRSTLDGCIVVRSMSSSIIVLGWPVRPIPASLIPAGTPVLLANCYTQNRVIQRSFCAAAIQSLACLLRVKTGSAPVEHKVSASPPKPDICALMSTRSNCDPAQTLKCSSGINGIAYTFFFEYPLFLLVPAKH